ncbi:MAG: nuclease-related domain-containing protein [Patescibacteria group bacterium]|nr:nuclease-related domain-containing protein [Patescibacteria group bacterium]
MKTIGNKKSYSESQLRKNRIIKYSALVTLLVIFIVLIKYAILPIFQPKVWMNANSWVILILIVLGAITGIAALAMSKWLESFFDKVNYNISISAAGDEGEKKVYDELRKVLDDKYTVYPNYIIPGHKFDLDFLIVGPKGLIVMEVKNFSNSTVFSEDKALSVKESGYKKEVTKLVGSSDPRNKIDIHCKVMNSYLNYLNFDNIKIRKVLVFAKDHITIEGKSKIYIVKKINELGQYFDSLYRDERFTPEFCEEINKKLLIN